MMLVIFDCDGVLIDSEAIYCQVDAEALTRLGVPMTTADVAERFAGIQHRKAWQMMADIYQLDLPPDWFDGIKAECEQRFEYSLKSITGVEETLSALQSLDVSLCVASSSEPETLIRHLEQTGINKYFGTSIFSTRQVKRSKPAPDVFLFAASQMGFDLDQIVVIEDSIAGVNAARRAGMQVIGFAGGGHAWPGLPERLKEAGASTVVLSMPELALMLMDIASQHTGQDT